MATVAALIERRRDHRLAIEGTSWKRDAVLRPGQAVSFVNISNNGALVESGARLRPGTRTELQLAGPAVRRTIRGRLERCHVVALEPLRYRGVVLFDQPEDVCEGRPSGE